MKHFVFFIIILAFGMSVRAQEKTAKPLVLDSTKKVQVVDASCGECQFKMPGKGCHLAVRIEDKTYFVDGTSIDDHGDAHAKEGFCESIRKADVQGEVVEGRFKVSYFKLRIKN